MKLVGETIPNEIDNCEQVLDLNYYNHEQSNRVYGTDKCSPTIRTGSDEAKAIKILDNSEKIIKVGNYGKGHHAKDVYDENGVMSTITTGNHGVGQSILIRNNTEKGYLEAKDGDGVNICGRMDQQRGNVQKESIPTLTTMGGNDIGVVIDENERK